MIEFRSIDLLVKPQRVEDGAGVSILRTIGSQPLSTLDPFLMLDHFESSNPDDYVRGFPDHPHRGFVTLTHMLDGHMLHRDSMGNTGNLKSGGVQWMKAARGVIHSEMPQQEQGLMRGFQLWINLPAVEKMAEPEYQEFSAADLPHVPLPDGTVTIAGGEYCGVRGPIMDPFTHLVYLDVRLGRDTKFHLDTDPSMTFIAYVFEGAVRCDRTRVPAPSLATFSRGSAISLETEVMASRLIIVGGWPLREPIAKYGPFVMNTREEIEQAIRDFNSGHLTA